MTTTAGSFDTWREAYDCARTEMRLEMYRGWGWAKVEKRDGKWWALIA